MQQVVNLAKEANVLVQFVPKKKLDQMVEGNHQGVLAQVAAYQYAEIDDLFAAAEKKNETPFFLLLDEIEDPHNLGSIMRTADASRCTWNYYSKTKSSRINSNCCESYLLVRLSIYLLFELPIWQERLMS